MTRWIVALGLLTVMLPGMDSAAMTLVRVDPTPLFPKQAAGMPLKQVAHLTFDNPGAPVEAVARITLGAQPPEMQPLGVVGKGKSIVDILVPDIVRSTPLSIEVLGKDGKGLASQQLDWQPQKKWTLLLTSYCHQDLGFGDYPHRIRTTVRHANINWPLEYCRETDNWPDTDKYRWNIETSEPIYSYVSFYGKTKAEELAQRIREGRIALGQAHTTVNSSGMNEEMLARLFYNGGRLVPDLLKAPRNKSIFLDDVLGFTSSFATYAAEAGCQNLFHGYNFGMQGERWPNGFITDTVAQTERGEGISVYAPGREAACFFEGSDGQKLFSLAVGYSIWGLQWNFDDRHETDKIDPKRVEHIMRGLVKHGWPASFDYMFIQDAMDFNLATRKGANRVHAWNQKYEWPRMATVTMDQYFETIAKEVKRNEAQGKTFKTFTGDNNDQWIDQKAATARLFGQALRTNAAVPATEKLATITQALAGGADGHADLQNAYNRMLQYHEHTDGYGWANPGILNQETVYATELAEHREEVAEADQLQAGVRANAVERLNQLITRPKGQSLVVFNPLPQTRTDIVRTSITAGSVVDSATGASIPVQQLPDGTTIFVATDVPATGYKVFNFSVERASARSKERPEGRSTSPNTLENRYYRLCVNPTNGVVTSLFDKELNQELVEQKAALGFNEYVYMTARPGTVGAPASWATSARMTQADEVVCARGTLADVVTISGKAGGVNKLQQTIILYHGIKKVDFSLWVDKAPAAEREALYVSLPLAISDFSIHHGVPGAVVEPYREQIEGSSTAHFGIQRFTDLSNGKFGVTISPEDSGVVCYGEQQCSGDHNYNRSREYPRNSRVYLYLMNNMLSVNIARDQRGPCAFHWSLRSHAGDWKSGGAAQFGASTVTPFVAWRADGKNSGSLPATASFLSVEAPNVTCTTIKPAESNGHGVILRFSENSGVATTTRVSVPFLGRITSVNETSLVEDDRNRKLPVTGDNSFTVTVRPFGVTTVRVVCDHDVPAAPTVTAQAMADMQVNLRWADVENAAHYNIYRDTDSACAASPLNFVGQTAAPSFSDVPCTHPGGLRSALEPGTTYYYRIVPVDRWNNPGAASAAAKATTLSPAEKNLPPVKVQGLLPVLVSERSSFNFINVMFHTSAESDIMTYEIYRSTKSGFEPGAGTLIGKVGSNDIIKGGDDYGHINIDYPVKEFDHAMFLDQTVEPGTTYYYKVRAVDAAGQEGECSEEAAIRTKGPDLHGCTATAQSSAEPRFAPVMALDGNPDPYFGWISKQYGGGTKAKPLDVWWAVEFPKPATLKGVKIMGDHRDIIPLQRNHQVQIRDGGVWKTAGELKGVTTKDVTVTFARPVTTSALRIFVPAADLPKSTNPDVDGWVRICELYFIMPDGKEKGIE